MIVVHECVPLKLPGTSAFVILSNELLCNIECCVNLNYCVYMLLSNVLMIGLQDDYISLN